MQPALHGTRKEKSVVA